MDELKKLQDSLGYTFSDISQLKKALTHPSYVNECKKDRILSNQRLEFFGDSVLSIAVSEYIFTNLQSYPEGKLTDLRAKVVCESALAKMARKNNLGDYILLGNGEQKSGGRNRDSILSDAMEAVIAAIYIDGGFDAAKDFVIRNLKSEIDTLKDNSMAMHNAKSALQELVQKNGRTVSYEVVEEMGPEHDKHFVVASFVDGKKISEGSGNSKKRAELNAASKALEILQK